MNCPLRSDDTTDLLLDYAAGKLDRARTELLEEHLNTCPRCAAFGMEQAAVWDALDLWEPEPVSAGFNRELWRKIDSADADEPWHERWARIWRTGAWKPAFPLAAAMVLIAAGFVYDHRAPAPSSSSSPVVTVSDADQVEKALDDIQLLRQFDAASTVASPQKTM